MNWLLARLAEPSTHAGLAAICSAIPLFFPGNVAVQQFCSGLAILLGGTAVVTSERGK